MTAMKDRERIRISVLIRRKAAGGYRLAESLIGGETKWERSL
jgi:hypothetical protein